MQRCVWVRVPPSAPTDTDERAKTSENTRILGCSRFQIRRSATQSCGVSVGSDNFRLLQDAYGVITFPTSLTFESDALGVTYSGEIEGNPMSLTLPLLGDTEEGPWATSPRPDLEVLDLGRGAGFGWSDGGAWHTERKRVTRVRVNAAYFAGTTPGPDDAAGHNAEIAAIYGEAVHTWYSKVISWLSVWTGFDLRPPLRPDEGPSAHLEFPTNGGSGFHPPMCGDFTSRGITTTEFRGAIKRASAGEDPALAWRCPDVCAPGRWRPRGRFLDLHLHSDLVQRANRRLERVLSSAPEAWWHRTETVLGVPPRTGPAVGGPQVNALGCRGGRHRGKRSPHSMSTFRRTSAPITGR